MKISMNAFNLSQMVQANGPVPDHVEVEVDDTLDDGWFRVEDSEPIDMRLVYPAFLGEGL
jgi:hypothetical protein